MAYVEMSLALVAAYPFALALVLYIYLASERRRYTQLRKKVDAQHGKSLTIGIFHPYANGGGGGERVLYCALCALVQKYGSASSTDKPRSLEESEKPRLRIALYTGDDGLTAQELIRNAAEVFNLPQLLQLKVEKYIIIVPLHQRFLLEPARYPTFTLLWQSVAHIRLALEAFEQSETQDIYPDIWMDTIGCAFTYLVAKVRFGCQVITYTHYPMISTDMLKAVEERRLGVNNSSDIANTKWKSQAKLIYYRLFALAYSTVGRYCVDRILVNGTWTHDHIRRLWGSSRTTDPIITYPPCGNMNDYMQYDLEASRKPIAISIAQFRPEKNHLLQIEAMKVLEDMYNAKKVGEEYDDFNLIMIGSCRNEDDEARVEELQTRVNELGLDHRIHFSVNASFDTLKNLLGKASIGLHTMYNEHFGISVAEMMAAGLLVVANNSGGPAKDIVVKDTGFLALTAEEYATAVVECLNMDDTEMIGRRQQSRLAAKRFSDNEFVAQFLEAVSPILERAVH